MDNTLQQPLILLLGFTEKQQTQVIQFLATHDCRLQAENDLPQVLKRLEKICPDLVLIDVGFTQSDANDIRTKLQPQLKGAPLLVVVENQAQAIAALRQGHVGVLNLQWPNAVQRQLDMQFVLIRQIKALRENIDQCVNQQQAEAENTSTTHFLATASHDLRQPLHSIQLLLEVLNSRLADDPRNLEIVQHMRASATGLNNLLDTLLNISKLDAGMVKPVLKPLRLKRLLAEVCQDLLPQAQEKAIRLGCYSREFLIHTDEQILKSILRNLIHNAIRYTDTGKIIVGTRQFFDQVEVQVWDTGVGIAKQDQKKVFEEFVQLGDTEKKGADGMGLGLFSVQKSAQLLGYQIRLVSKKGKGTMFALRLPFSR